MSLESAAVPDGSSADKNSQMSSSDRVPENVDSSDDFISSEDDLAESHTFSGTLQHRVGFGASLAEHADYFTNTLSHALDSAQMDRSLVVQARLSGHINNKNQQLVEKKQELLEKLQLLKQLHEKHVGSNRLGQLEKDIKDISSRLDVLITGTSRRLILGKKRTLGVAQKYPVEYNQAKDRVLERDYEEV